MAGTTRHRSLVALGALAGIVLALQVVALTAGFTSEDATDAVVTWGYRLLMIGSALVTLVRAVIVPEQRYAWAMIGFGLLAWGSGDVAYDIAAGDGTVSYPGFADYLYLTAYLLLLGGLRALGGKVRDAGALSLSLIVTLLGLATIWSWLVYDSVLNGLEGGTAAVAVTAAYPLLDLFLLASTLIAVAAQDWRLDRSFLALIAGFSILAIGDSLYTAQVAAGTYAGGTLIEIVWPASAVAIASAAWLRPGPRREGVGGERLVPALTTAATAVAIFVLAYDHFDRVSTTTLVLALATSVGALLHLGLLFFRHRVAETRASQAEALRSASTEAALDSVITFDRHGVITEWNDAARNTFGLRAEEAIGSLVGDLADPPVEPRIAERTIEMLSTRPVGSGERIEMMARHARGGSFPVEVSLSRIAGDPPMFVAIARDITERRRREAENERLAAIVRSSEDAILSKDLEGRITAWNRGAEQLYGFSADEVIGRPIREVIIPPERWHEYEWIVREVLAQGSASLETQRVTKGGKVVDVNLRAFPIRSLDGEVIGVSTSAHDLTEKRERERRERRERERRLWMERVEEALEDGRLRFWGQPVFDAATGEPHHHELLLRMELDGQTITPNLFLPHVESTDLMTRIDRWAVREGIKLGAETPVAINLSARSLDNPRLLDWVKDDLAQFGTDPADVVFEITETAAAENLEDASKFVSGLSALGCSVALDDFGTGYGSFTYLKYLPVSQLKIDITFIRNLTSDQVDRRVVTSIAAVAENFGMQTVAEGVEDGETMEELKSIGVDLVQGFHLGYPRPMRADAPAGDGTVAAAS